MRADQLLVERGLAPSRSAAQRLIKADAVRWRIGALFPAKLNTQQSDQIGTKLVDKAGLDLPDDCELVISDDAELRYVSRAGLKLEGALTRLEVNPSGWNCLDIGSSTGGFADCLLQRNAKLVLGFDVGHGQLHDRLQRHPQMINCEGVNARHLSRESIPAEQRDFTWQLAVIDVSFISLSLVLAPVVHLLEPQARLIALVKPQFELGDAALTKTGRARTLHDYDTLKEKLLHQAKQIGLHSLEFFDSPITGQDGNREFFLSGVNL